MSVLAVLKQFPLFQHLRDEDIVVVASELSRVALGASETVFQATAHGDSMGLLVSGKLAVFVEQSGEPTRVGFIYPQEIFGEMSCIVPGPRGATVVAETDADMFFLSRDGLDRVTVRAPEIGVALRRDILRVLTARLQEVDARIEIAYSAGTMPAFEYDDDSDTVSPEALRSIPLLEGFSEAEIRALITVAPPRFYPPGHVLCRQGATGDSVFIITRGVVDVVLTVAGVEQAVAHLGPGSIAGQMSLVTGEPRTATLVASRRSLILTLAVRDFERLLAAQSPFAVRFQLAVIGAAVDQLRAANLLLARTPAA